jgi:hypothetical protein
VVLVIARRILGLAMIAGASGMACTAIVLGSIGDFKDYGVDSGSFSSASSSSSSSGSSSSSSSSGADDPCSLLKPYYYSPPNPENDCSRCIEASCKSDVDTACNDGKDKKEWFQYIAGCAQSPWVEYPTPGSSGSTWGCGRYDKDAGPISGTGDQALERQSEICIRDKCLNSSARPCRLCDVSTKGTGSDDKDYLLRADRCGKLFGEHCNATIVDCCRSQAVREYLTACSNTEDPDNLTKCKGLLDAKTDPTGFKSAHPGGWGDTDFQCASKLADCFDAHKGQYQCD